MKTSSFIARKYFFSRKSGNAVNIISAISMAGIMVGTAALIIVLSAFNGLEGLVKSFYQSFDPDIKSSLVSGKYFHADTVDIEGLRNIEGVERVSLVLEERVLLTFRDKEYIATLKGVDSNYSKVSELENSLLTGFYNVSDKYQVSGAVLGAGVSYYLGYSRLDFDMPINAYVPAANSGSDFSRAFVSDQLYPTGIFRIQPEFDDKFVVCGINFVRELLNRQGAATAIEFKISERNKKKIQREIAAVLGNNFLTQNRAEQQEVLLKVMRTENLFTFIVFALILAISTFTIMGSIIMLMLEKKDNIHTLWAFGSTLNELQSIFFKTGMLICLSGAISGLLLGTGVIALQYYFGLVKLGPGYALDAYPVILQIRDVFVVGITVIILSSISCWFTSRQLGFHLFKTKSI